MLLLGMEQVLLWGDNSLGMEQVLLPGDNGLRMTKPIILHTKIAGNV